MTEFLAGYWPLWALAVFCLFPSLSIFIGLVLIYIESHPRFKALLEQIFKNLIFGFLSAFLFYGTIEMLTHHFSIPALFLAFLFGAAYVGVILFYHSEIWTGD